VNLCLHSSPYSFNCQASVSYALQNNTVFESTQNWVGVNDGPRTDNGSEIHRIGPETAERLCLYLVVLERGTTRSPHAAEWSWPRLADSDTGVHSSVRYVGVAWCRHLYTTTRILHSSLCWTGSRCSRRWWCGRTSAYAVWFQLQHWAHSVEAGPWPRSHAGGQYRLWTSDFARQYSNVLQVW